MTVKPYELKGLNEDTWRQYSSSRDIATDSPALTEMWKAYGGNAKAMGNKENSYAYAELFYEYGLSLQKNGEVDESRQYFQYAILLFNQVGAFEKTEEVRRAMEGRK